jgi:uncharacterized protein
MLGTCINTLAVVAGSAVGLAVGARLPGKMRETVLHGIGLVTMLIGFQMALQTKNVLIVLGAVLIGGVTGELLNIHGRLERLGEFLASLFGKGPNHRIGEGFVTASLLFCIGPMAILGSIQDGLTGDYRLLSIKSMLDGFASIAFAASLGWGVALASLSVLAYQGTITLFAGGLSSILTEPMIAEMSATGGVLIIGIGFKLMEIKDLRLANLLPAIAIAPALVWVVPLVGRLVGM